jgi:glyoxylase-like metal-dependent hydrolase (beta-lactamase superfamily II)
VRKELAPGIHVLGGKKGGRVRAFLVENGPKLTLVDTLFEEDARLVLQAIHEIGRKVEDLEHIVLTHAHRSHLGGLAELKRLSGATVHSHEREADIVGGERVAERVSLVPHAPLRVYFPYQLFAALGKGAHVPCPVDAAIGHDDEVGGLRVLHVPGHTPGHLGFYSEGKGVLIAGDAISTWPSFAPGWGSFTLNKAQHRMSVRELAGLEPKILGVGHGDPVEKDAADRLHSLVW